MMSANWLLILLPIAAIGGWHFSRYETLKNKGKGQIGSLPLSLMAGLNQLLCQEDDKALKTFLELSQEQPNYPELQLTLGSLSRRKGEFERATYIHQSIIDNTVYSNSVRELARFELAKDYYAAGLYDRAEELFLELKTNHHHTVGAIKHLLEIYQHEKDWLSAIELLNSDGAQSHEGLVSDLTHYYCERAEELMALGDFKAALECAHRAKSMSDANARVIILLGKISAHRGRHEEAILQWKKLQWHEPHYLGEVIGHVNNSYEILGKHIEFAQFLKSAVRINPDPRLVSFLITALKKENKPQSIKKFVTEYLREKPTLGGVHQLMINWLDVANEKLDQDTVLIVESISKLIANERDYACIECGFTANKLHWQCPACQKWDVLKPSHVLNTTLPNNPLSKMPELFENVAPKVNASILITKPKESL